jgi:hypothetical protein
MGSRAARRGREAKRKGTAGRIASASPEQAEGWDLTRQVSTSVPPRLSAK